MYRTTGCLKFDPTKTIGVEQFVPLPPPYQIEVVNVCLRSNFMEAFCQIDTDQSGSLSHDEMKVVMQELGDDMNEQRLSEMIAEFDVDGDGEIDYNEFMLMMQSRRTGTNNVDAELMAMAIEMEMEAQQTEQDSNLHAEGPVAVAGQQDEKKNLALLRKQIRGGARLLFVLPSQNEEEKSTVAFDLLRKRVGQCYIVDCVFFSFFHGA